MANISKPDGLNLIWSNSGDILKPSDAKISQGWAAEIPPRQWFNYIDNKQDQGLAHINQHGIAVWDSVTEYQANSSYVQGSNGKIYFCINTNTNQNPVNDSTNTYWLDYQASGYVVLTSTQTWTVPLVLRLGLKQAKVSVTAGGGSGGSGVTNGSYRGSGGGAGGTAISVLNLAGVNTVLATVGAGGASPTTTSADGNSGGGSSFGSYLSALGGGIGVGYNSTNSPAGGAGGGSSGGQLNIKGGSGSDAPALGGNGIGGSGDGGSSLYGGGSRGSSSVTLPTQAYGSGGGGAVSGGSAGAPGVIIIEW